LLLCLLGRYAAAQDAVRDVSKGKDRVHVFDNARFLCSCGVVTYHVLANNEVQTLEILRASYPDWFTNGMLSWGFNSNWAMAGFSVLSGALSKDSPSYGRFQSLILGVLLPFLLHSLVFEAIFIPWLQTSHIDLTEFVNSLFDAGIRVTWYLQALIFWKLLAWGCQGVASSLSVRVWQCFVPASLILLIVSSYVSLDVWGLGNGIAYLPCFAAGLLLPVQEMLAAVPQRPLTILLGLITCLIWSMGGHGTNFLPLKYLHWNLSQDDSYIQTSHFPCVSPLSWCEGFFTALLMTTVFLAGLLLLCPRSQHWFTDLGKASIYSYLLHTPLFVLWHTIAPKIFADMPVAMMLPVSWAVCIVLCSPPTQVLFMPILDPRRCWNSVSALILAAKPDEVGQASQKVGTAKREQPAIISTK